MQIYSNLDANFEGENGIVTFITMKLTLIFKIQGGIHPHIFLYTASYNLACMPAINKPCHHKVF